MKKICIIQLTRLGDILQTIHAVKEIKKHHSNVQLHLIARKQFAHPLRFLLDQYFDQVIYIELSQLVKPNLGSSIAAFKEFTDAQSEYNYDVLINLSFSKSSSYLSSLIGAKFKLGLLRNEYGEIQIQDKWSQFVFYSVMAGVHNPYNLVDLFKNIIGSHQLSCVPATGAITSTKHKRIAIHPFASNKNKAWTTSKWAEVIYGLAKSHPDYNIAILGGPDEKLQANEIVNNPLLKGFRLENYVGSTSVEDIFNLLKNSDCFVGNDSMISHLASFLTVPILTISTGPVRPHESVPYRENVITICSDTKCYPCTVSTKCDFQKCHKDITHNLVVDLVSALVDNKEINEGFIKNNLNVFHLSNVKIYKSHIRKDYSMELIELTSNELSYDDTLRMINRIVFDLYFKNHEYHNPIPKLSNSTAHRLVEDLKIITQLFELYGHGQTFAKRLLDSVNAQADEVKEYISKIQEVEKIAIKTKPFSPAVAILVDFFNTSLKNTPGNSLKEIAENYLVGFNDATSLTAMVFELIQQMVSPYIKVNSPGPTA